MSTSVLIIFEKTLEKKKEEMKKKGKDVDVREGRWEEGGRRSK